MFKDKLSVATDSLLKAVGVVTKEITAKKQVILDAEIAINEAKEAIQHAKDSLSM